jgi:hypothetical protein
MQSEAQGLISAAFGPQMPEALEGVSKALSTNRHQKVSDQGLTLFCATVVFADAARSVQSRQLIAEDSVGDRLFDIHNDRSAHKFEGPWSS